MSQEPVEARKQVLRAAARALPTQGLEGASAEAQRRLLELPELDAQVAERDSSIAELVRAQEASKRGRNDASKRVDRLLAQVERLERDGK